MARKRGSELKHQRNQSNAATKLQAAQRRRNAKKEVRELKTHRAEERRIKEEMEYEQRLASTRLQALYRGNQSRVKNMDYIENLKKEKVRKEALIMARAVVRMQCGWRKNRARKVFKRRQKEFTELEKIRLEDEELERNLEDLHREQELLLYVMRLQNVWRVRKAKKKFDLAKIAKMKVGEVKKEERKKRAIVMIQSWARGLKWREWMRVNLSTLLEEAEYRAYCVECMAVYATRRCSTCMDKYCNSCWDIIHRAGRKRQHGWDDVEPPRTVSSAYGQQESYEPGSSLDLGTNSMLSSQQGSVPGEWVEYFDDSVGSSYWYNTRTNEASWVKPF